MAVKRIAARGKLPLTNGTQVISLTNSTALSLNSTLAGAHIIQIGVETNDVRYWPASAPTLATGILLAKDWVYEMEGLSSGWNLTFQRSTGSATVHVAGYTYE